MQNSADQKFHYLKKTDVVMPNPKGKEISNKDCLTLITSMFAMTEETHEI